MVWAQQQGTDYPMLLGTDKVCAYPDIKSCKHQRRVPILRKYRSVKCGIKFKNVFVYLIIAINFDNGVSCLNPDKLGA